MDAMDELRIERDEMVYTADGVDAGRVKHVIVDRASQQLTDLVIERDDEEVVVPITDVVRGPQGALMLNAMPTHANTMHFTREEYHEVDEDEITGMSVGTGATRTGGATIEHADDDSVVVDDAAANRAAGMRRQPATGRTDRTTDTGENITVPVVEEQLTAGVRETEAGRFRLSKTVTEEQKTINVPLEREEVHITERAVDRRPATQAELGAMNRDIEIPLREQEAVVSKEARVTGEVEIRKEVVRDTQQVTDTVRREEVHVDDAKDPRVHVEGERGMRGRADAGQADASGAGKTVTDKRKYDAQGNLVDEQITEKPNR